MNYKNCTRHILFVKLIWSLRWQEISSFFSMDTASLKSFWCSPTEIGMVLFRTFNLLLVISNIKGLKKKKLIAQYSNLKKSSVFVKFLSFRRTVSRPRGLWRWQCQQWGGNTRLGFHGCLSQWLLEAANRSFFHLLRIWWGSIQPTGFGYFILERNWSSYHKHHLW